ncbi:MAG TPA: ATP-binding protein [Fibrobacteria bacterium]|nr:ATP-binding protein [Fibrobacteria bacterium]
MSILTDIVESFATSVSGNIRDMVGSELDVQAGSLAETKFVPARGMAVMIHFTGAIQGEFALSLSEETAAKILGAWSDGMGPDDLREMRSDFGGFLKECLNTSVGQAIPLLEREFDALTFLPSVLVYGELEYPDVPAGFMSISGAAGELDCYFVLNLMGLELGERLQAALKALGESAREATAAKRSVTSMLEAFPSALVTVGRDGRVRPGYARITPETVGLDRDAPIPGLHMVELLGLGGKMVMETNFWLEVVYDKWGVIPFKDLVGLCPISETENERGLILLPKWVPLRAEDGSLDGLLLMVENVTEKRRVEAEMKKLSRLHEENVELVTQIVNLEPDEVQDFVYDSSGLLREAEKVVQTASRDRQFIETLYRTVHTLKGNSGQFQFKGLQKLALEIEDNISQLRERSEWEEATADLTQVAKIQEGLAEAEGYVRRLEELRGKLGQKDESAEDKVARSTPSVMAQLSDIESVAATIWDVHQAGRALGWPQGTLALISSAAASAAALREIEFGRLARSLAGVIGKVAARLGKKATFSMAGSGPIDIEILRILHRCMVHLVNNSLDHGLEKPSDRIAVGKLETGLLVLEYTRHGQILEISFSDDGVGIDPETLRQKAVEKGFMDPEEARIASHGDLLDLLFRSGFSTREKVGEFSGRGVGLDMVRDTIQSLGGKIHLESVPGCGTTFRIRIPISIAIPSTRFLTEAEA